MAAIAQQQAFTSGTLGVMRHSRRKFGRRKVIAETLVSALRTGLPLAALSIDWNEANAQDDRHRPASPAPDETLDILARTAGSRSVEHADSIADLLRLKDRPEVVVVMGYRLPGDGGGGLFVWAKDAVTSPDDVLNWAPDPNLPGRYVRQCASAINVKWAGATGQANTDDTAAFRTALAAGDAVFVPPGTYLLSGALKIDGKTLFGAGPQSILKCAEATFNLLEVSGVASRVQNLAVWGAATDESSGQFGITTSTAYPPEDFVISDVRFSGPSEGAGLNNAIKCDDGARNGRILNCHFERLIGVTSGHGYGVLTGAVDGLTVIGNTFEGSLSARQGRHAVYVSAGGRRVSVTHNIARDFSSEALATNAYAHQEPVHQVVFANNIIHRCGNDGVNQSSIGIVGRAQSVRIEGNIVIDSVGCGILCDAGSVLQESVSVRGNTIMDARYIGIRQLGGVHQSVQGNYVKGSSRSSPGQYADIMVGAGHRFMTEQALVSNNQCVPVEGISGRAFVLDQTRFGPKRARVTGNDFRTAGYVGAPLFGSGDFPCEVDGRLQSDVRLTAQTVHPRSASRQTFRIAGAAKGDVVSCASSPGGLPILTSASVKEEDVVEVVFMNISDAAIDIADSETMKIDVWNGIPRD